MCFGIPGDPGERPEHYAEEVAEISTVDALLALVKEGKTINKNDSIITLESDKSSVEVPSTYSGKIEKIKKQN